MWLASFGVRGHLGVIDLLVKVFKSYYIYMDFFWSDLDTRFIGTVDYATDAESNVIWGHTFQRY